MELDPLSIPVNAYLGQIHLFAGEYDAAAERFRRASQLDPSHPLIRHNLGELQLARGQFEEAISELQRAAELSAQLSGVPSSHYLAMAGCAYARAKRRDDALEILDELTARDRQSLVSTFDMAALHTALGETEEALAWLERGYEQRDAWLSELKAWPWFDDLREEPRFQDLLRRMRFPT